MKSGFTLLELIVVVSILLIVAVIGLGSFSMSRRTLVLDLEGDNFVAALYTLRETSRSEPKCTGMRLKKNQPAQKIEWPFKDNACDAGAESRTAYPLAKEVAFGKILLDGGEAAELEIRFIPPYGLAQFIPGGQRAEVVLSPSAGTGNQRTVSLDRLTGKIEKL